MEMDVLFGEIKQTSKLDSLVAEHDSLTGAKVREVFFIASSQDQLSEQDCNRLSVLFPNTHFAVSQPLDEHSQYVWVVPRVGTISPWSSRATEIAHLCGVSAVDRIEQGLLYVFESKDWLSESTLSHFMGDFFDQLTENVLFDWEHLQRLFEVPASPDLIIIPVQEEGMACLREANSQLGLALNEKELAYLHDYCLMAKKDLTDVELMMFAQVNSEHCRHKVFNAHYWIDGKEKEHSLFDLIRQTYQQSPEQVLVAYKDNAAVIKQSPSTQCLIDHEHRYYFKAGDFPMVLKAETHNHPTAISPMPGAATGSGGEIRDEAATGRGSQARVGFSGYSVSNLHIPDLPQPWEHNVGRPQQIASALEIILQAPIGAARYNNEFGRPAILGYFRSLGISLMTEQGAVHRGYHKPVMIAGGLGYMQGKDVNKAVLKADIPLIVLGGPAMAIGLGGSAASSRVSQDDTIELDFASVQRAQPEMERRTQEVINHCCQLEPNPILSIHDVGAGGLSNALPEIVENDQLGAIIQLRDIPNAALSMSPAEIWCNEAQERFVLAIDPTQLETFKAIAQRERCPFAVVGKTTKQADFIVNDEQCENQPVYMPMDTLLGKLPAMVRQTQSSIMLQDQFSPENTCDLAEAIARVLQLPCVADKSFLVTIGDRSVGGLVARDSMIGPWQVPVSDVGVSAADFKGHLGQALALGERAPIALLHPAASARMALGEAITNIAAADIKKLSDVVLSANWMAAMAIKGEDANLYDAVQALVDSCVALGICIPVGKDSLSMQSTWREEEQEKTVSSPVTLVVTACAAVQDIRQSLTPQLSDQPETELLLIDLGRGSNALGGSALAQVYQSVGSAPADLDSPQILADFFAAIGACRQQSMLLAYHDRSDGGLLATICEMMFASHLGCTLQLSALGSEPLSCLFTEELGAVIQIKKADRENVLAIFAKQQLIDCVHVIGEINHEDQLRIFYDNKMIYENDRISLHRLWSATSYHLQALRDNPECAKQQYDLLLDKEYKGLQAKPSFDINENIVAPFILQKNRPKVAILREQGVNGHVEMAAAFHLAGFDCIDVHMSDLLQGRATLNDMQGLAVCGGFSFGDVLGAGRGWASTILVNNQLSDEFAQFFQRADTFTLGVCNGCQMLSHLTHLIPGSDAWPSFIENQSQQFEARLSQVEIMPSPSIFFNGMVGSVLPIIVSHGEGRVAFDSLQQKQCEEQLQVCMRYVDGQGQATMQYPLNPNGSDGGITALTSVDGRVTCMMPHPERVFRTTQFSWHPEPWQERSPWLRMFENARLWLG